MPVRPEPAPDDPMQIALLAFFFSGPFSVLATAAGAVSVPVIIHLLNRKRFKVVTWAAMRFLLAAQKKNSRRMRLEQLILLVVRCLVVLLLLVGLLCATEWAAKIWKFFFPGASAAVASTNLRTHKALVLDGSFSMGQQLGEQQNAFDRAREQARKVVEDSPRGDAFSVVLLSAPPRRIVGEPSEDPEKVKHEIQNLRLPHGN